MGNTFSNIKGQHTQIVIRKFRHGNQKIIFNQDGTCLDVGEPPIVHENTINLGTRNTIEHIIRKDNFYRFENISAHINENLESKTKEGITFEEFYDFCTKNIENLTIEFIKLIPA